MMLGMLQNETVRVAEWQTFPWAPLLTLSTTLTALMLGALVNYLRKIFLLREEANAMAAALRAEVGAVQKRVVKIDQSCIAATRAAEEAYRLAELADRAVGEQWRRVSEEIIGPVKDMSRDLRETREMLVRYVQTQDGHGKDIDRLERRIEAHRKGGSGQ
jgi:hypothetical protein